MARFRYRMQNILNIKISLEDQARMQYAAANARLREEEEKLEALRRKKLAYEDRAKELMLGKLDIMEIESNNQSIVMTDGLIKQQMVQVRTAQMNADRARKKMTEQMQERKTQERLREKAFEEFLLEEKAAESKEIDQLTSYTFGQKIRENGNGSIG